MMKANTVIDRSRAPAWLAAVLLNLLAGSANAASLDIEFSLPAIPSAAYHSPYVAVWIENIENQSVAGTLAVWYDRRLRDELGKIFLQNLRSWWRKAGKTLTLPADGVSGATRGPGTHALHFAGNQGALAQLPGGKYMLAIEVAREQGGRTVLRTPFSWGGGDGMDGSRSVPDGSAGAEVSFLKATVSP
ncbi:DUF2271 domain-containing protein [Herbaspirillum lusitanum]|uniref:DUF2271 domain-containing protein n=1 Tax=Herbaspirillum lusitanum TaxID=213312 RepID=A0ABW9A4H2_9BURK